MWDMLILKMHHACGIQASLGAPRHPAALAMGGGESKDNVQERQEQVGTFTSTGTQPMVQGAQRSFVRSEKKEL